MCAELFSAYCPSSFCTCSGASGCVAVGEAATNPSRCRDNCAHTPPYCPPNICSPDCVSPTPTSSSSRGVTASATRSGSRLPSPTQTRTRTSPQSQTPSRTKSPSQSRTSSRQPSQTPSATNSHSQSSSPSSSNSQVPTPSESPSQSPSGGLDAENPSIDLVLAGAPFSFQQAGAGFVQLTFSGTTATISIEASVSVLINNQLLPEANIIIAADGTSITLVDSLRDGLNTILCVAEDLNGSAVVFDDEVWAGSGQLVVLVANASNEPVLGAEVVVTLSDDTLYSVTGFTDANGRFAVQNVPFRTLFVSASFNNEDIGGAVTVGPGLVSIILTSSNQPLGSVKNLDFSSMADGWVLTAFDSANHFFLVNHAETKQANLDLMLFTNGSPPGAPVTAQHTFMASANSNFVRVRYRFMTSEVPGGWFGSEFNDGFTVSVLVEGGGSKSETSSMNALGLAAFDSQGNTKFRELTVTVPKSDQPTKVTVIAQVENVADNLFDSALQIDVVFEGDFSIASATLFDFHPSAGVISGPLTFLSCGDFPGDYYGNGVNRLQATMTVVGSPGDSVASVHLVIQGHLLVELLPEKQAILYQPFGDSRRLTFSKQRAFDIPNTVLAGIAVAQNGVVSLALRARSTGGQEHEFSLGTVAKMARYTGSNRYDNRDPSQGGDDWALPTTIDYVAYFSSVYSDLEFGDFSNMNGQTFPPHKSHKFGNDVDVKFPNYEKRNAAVAHTLIGHLNDSTFGSHICQVYVLFAQNSAFYNAIHSVTLNDGRLARAVIIATEGHDTHFHWRFSSSGSACAGTNKHTQSDTSSFSYDLKATRSRELETVQPQPWFPLSRFPLSIPAVEHTLQIAY
eukprot:c19897_g1_i3.p1 GENE.c19897_g1_i3~~c19897_g1_i3.p1  ORF type:complete len:851 (+),score=141.58 c19897_g1_i3:246-2798(+)